MCGIVGYVGKRDAAPLLMDGLRRSEYRGYDSAGICTLGSAGLQLRKCVGRVAALADKLRKIKARKGSIIAVATAGDKEVARKADDVIYVPRTLQWFYLLLTAVPLQLLAYHIAVVRGCDVDRPRNLAKSVTVE